jgi:flagellar biosynthesis anti-sigma factor FlgM
MVALKVGQSGGTNVVDLYGGQTAGPAAGAKRSANAADQADISQKGKDLQAIMNHLKSLPDVRVDLVFALKQQVAAGTYRVDSSMVVDGMLQERKIFQEAAKGR